MKISRRFLSAAALMVGLPLLADAWTLQQCLDYALVHSPSLAKQQLTVNTRKLERLIAEASFDTQLRASGTQRFSEQDTTAHTLSLTRNFQNGFSVTAALDGTHVHDQDQTNASASIRLSKQLLGGGSTLETTYHLEASIIEELTALNNLQRQQRRLILDVTLAYYGIIRSQQSLQVKERALENAKRTLEITREREKPLDILTAELRVPDNELAVNTARRQIKNGLDNLKELIGLPVGEELTLDDTFQFKTTETHQEADRTFARENLETFLNNRLEQKRLKLLLEIRDENRLPEVTLNAAFIQHGDGNGYNFSGSDEQQLGISMNWTIGRRADMARYHIANDNYQKNQHDYFILAQQLDRDMANTIRQLQESEQAVKLQEYKCELLKRKEELYRDRWENGEIDILELVRTQTDLEDSVVDLIGRKVSYMELLANYHFIIGK